MYLLPPILLPINNCPSHLVLPTLPPNKFQFATHEVKLDKRCDQVFYAHVCRSKFAASMDVGLHGWMSYGNVGLHRQMVMAIVYLYISFNVVLVERRAVWGSVEAILIYICITYIDLVQYKQRRQGNLQFTIIIKKLTRGLLLLASRPPTPRDVC